LKLRSAFVVNGPTAKNFAGGNQPRPEAYADAMGIKLGAGGGGLELLPVFGRRLVRIEMKENWRSYFCNVNDSLASILVDLGLEGEAPIASKPWLLWTWVYFRSPRADGLWDSTEFPTLSKMEDSLTSEVSRACGAVLCGRITTEGRREFYFYGETREGFNDAVATALRNFSEYSFDTGDQEDPLWDQYFNVLYPSPEDLERIKNRKVLDVLEAKGDVLTAAREIQHWMYFKSEMSRLQVKEAVANLGFRIVSESNDGGNLSFGISVSKVQPVDEQSIDATVIELLHLAQQFEGEYDGWETPVITQ
jgi:uncharacterized protein (TIGR01619 family)